MLFKKDQLVRLQFFLLFSLFFLFLFLAAYSSFSVRSEQQFVALAQSFTQGKLYFLNSPPLIWDDSVFFKGQYFWPQNFFPAVLLLPFVVVFDKFGVIFLQGYLHFFLVLATILLYWKMAIKFNYSKLDALYLAFAFCFASSYLGLALFPWAWFFAQVITTLVLSIAVYLFLFHKRNYLLIGFLIGLATLTRIDTFLATVFFILMIAFSPGSRQGKAFNLVALLCFPLLAVAACALYNFARFENALNFGHSLIPRGDWHKEFIQQGVINIAHLPRNLFYVTIGPPIITLSPFSIAANPWGMSIFLTSPYLFYLFVLKPRDLLSRSLLITSGAILLLLLCLFTSGAKQLGYRYLMDFFPFLFPFLIRSYQLKYKSLSPLFKIIILTSALANLYLFSTIYK